MTTTQINGGTQIQSGTITHTQLASAAGITDGQLADDYILADGTRAFTGNVNGGNNEAVEFADPTVSTSLATKGYVDTLISGASSKSSARAATVGTETFTIASGTVTQISGTTIDGQAPNVGEQILVKDAPAASGTGSVNSSEPANGLYTVTANTTNLTVTRSSDMSTGSPAGAYVFVESGTKNGSNGWVVSSPSSSAAFTYGTTAIKWVQFSGAGEITTDVTLDQNGNELTRAAITGDVTVGTGSNAATIAAGAVSLSKMANLAAKSLIGNTSGSAATPAAVPLTSTGAANSVPLLDSSGNMAVNALATGASTTTTANGTTTLTVSSDEFQQFTGTQNQTVKLPVATTLVVGARFTITNRSTGLVTVEDAGSSTLQAAAAASQVTLTLLNNSTSAGVWDVAYSITNAGTSSATGTVTAVSVASAHGFAGTVANSTTTPAISIETTVTGLLKGDGTGVSAAVEGEDYAPATSGTGLLKGDGAGGFTAAVAGTDYEAPGSYLTASNLVTREQPSGTINGTTTAFTVANTPVTGTEMVFLNGLLQDAGGNDYTMSGTTITFVTAPMSGDKIRVTYWKA